MPALLDSLNERLDPEAIRQLSDQTGADLSSTRQGTRVALPLLVSQLAYAAETGGMVTLDEALARDHDGSFIDLLEAVLARATRGTGLTDAANDQPSGISVDRRAVDGNGILDHLLGEQRPAVEVGISRASGLQVEQVNQLLPLLAVVAMSAPGHVRQHHNLNAEEVKALLLRERDALEQAAGTNDEPATLRILQPDREAEIIERVARAGQALRATSSDDQLLS